VLKCLDGIEKDKTKAKLTFIISSGGAPPSDFVARITLSSYGIMTESPTWEKWSKERRFLKFTLDLAYVSLNCFKFIPKTRNN